MIAVEGVRFDGSLIAGWGGFDVVGKDSGMVKVFILVEGLF